MKRRTRSLKADVWSVCENSCSTTGLKWLGLAVVCGLAACTPVSKSYQIHTAEMTCEEAARHVHDTVVAMGMDVTGFVLPRPGSPGYLKGTRTDTRGTVSGRVSMRCDADGVHIVADQSGLLPSEHEFERGVYLGVTGRAGLVAERDGRGIGRLVPRDSPSPTGAAAATKAGSTGAGTEPGEPSNEGSRRTAAKPSARKVTGVQVRLVPLRGFSTVLDFEADVSRVGILPVKVTIVNGTNRAYEFDPRDIILRKAGARERIDAMTVSQAVERLMGRNVEVVRAGGAQAGAHPEVGPVDAGVASELGDVASAARIIRERSLRPARLRPYAEHAGYLYFEVADYDRARITMTDVATGETEGFIVDF